jgi:phosphatidylserine/phosphatidylglycerophosphate/cardiolipin synthase-like enzyme
MATDGVLVLPPNQIAASVRRLVDDADEFLLLVSPYFKPWPQMQGSIEAAVKRRVDVRLIVREDHVEEARARLVSCRKSGVKVLSVMKLHAKLYVTETAAILTSMNLVDASAQESWEAGILVEQAKAPDVYERIRQQAEECVYTAADVAPPEKPQRTRESESKTAKTRSPKGFCVRCAKPIRLDDDKPLCSPCYGNWKKYGNAEYTEKHCHACGKAAATCVAKPLCRPCYSAAR